MRRVAFLFADDVRFATFDDGTQLWRCLPLQAAWPAVVITAA
jgi:hypothetical protein